ncbi:MAG: hypothetical protein FH753_00765 [Firmicutes bacterium]|nr:hypothetical protein [Bacillota bacterium]MTI69735.1 hypothetical protein [Bacillota bacterium]
MDFNIKIEGKNKYTRYGYIKGEIGKYKWYALVHKESLNNGIDPNTLEKGKGKITRLCVYKDVNINSDTHIKRYIFANYKRGWDVLSKNHKELIIQLVEYLDRRYNIVVIK